MSASAVARRWRGAVGLIVCPFVAAGAQTLRGRVIDGATNRPVAGAVVTLLSDTLRVAASLTDSAGSFMVTAAGAGRYRVRVDRVGMVPFRPDAPLALAPGEDLVRDIRLPLSQARLSAVRVTASGACAASGIVGDDAGRVWEQASAALRAAQLTAEQALVPLELSVEEVQQPTAVGARLRVPPRRRPTQVWRTSTPRAFETPEGHDVVSMGFRAMTEDTLHYVGPDASVALSEGFLATHCFRVVRPGGRARGGGRVGLAFAPLDSTRATFLRGTMWLDEASSRLESIGYEYVVPGWQGGIPRPEGSIDFAPMASGAWIVREWRMRIPMLSKPADAEGLLSVRHVATYEKRGRARPMAAGDARVGEGTPTRPALLTGFVFDSLAGGPVPDVVITVDGRPATRTDRSGAYRVQLDGLPAAGATVIVNVGDPLLRRYLADRSEQRVLAIPGDTLRVPIESPPVAALLARACPDADAPAEDRTYGTRALGAVYVAAIRQPGDTTALRGMVEWTWQDGMKETRTVVEDAFDDDGVFVACPVAIDRGVTLVIADAAGTRVRLDLGPAPARVQAVRVEVPRPTAPAAPPVPPSGSADDRS